MLSGGTYKPNQGRIARYGTLAALLVLVVFGAYSWSQIFTADEPVLKWGLPVALGALISWAVYRLVHYPPFADFLIATEGEMAKVKWPTPTELRNATAVILANVIIMSVFLFSADVFWKALLSFLNILKIGGLFGSGGQGM